jgi:hypothetical protein
MRDVRTRNTSTGPRHLIVTLVTLTVLFSDPPGSNVPHLAFARIMYGSS